MSSERPHPATDRNRYRDPQPNARSSSVNPVEEGRKDCRRQWGQENTQNLGSQGLTETELTTREPVWDQPRSSAYMLQMCNLVFL